MTINELGKRLKVKYPQYASLSDQQAGELLLQKYPEYSSSLDVPKPPLFTGRAIERMQKETAYTVEAINHANAPHIAQKAVEDTIAERARLREAADSTHLNLITQNENATKLKVDLPTASLIRLEEERVKTEVAKARKLTAIKVSENRHLERNRLQAYEREVHIDMQAALGMHMMDVEKLDYLAHKIAQLKKQNAEPERIAALERVRVQMERRLLETDDQEHLAGIDPPSEG